MSSVGRRESKVTLAGRKTMIARRIASVLIVDDVCARIVCLIVILLVTIEIIPTSQSWRIVP